MIVLNEDGTNNKKRVNSDIEKARALLLSSADLLTPDQLTAVRFLQTMGEKI